MREVHKERLLLFANRLTFVLDNQFDEGRPIIRNSWIENEIGEWFNTEYDMNIFFMLPPLFKEWSFYEPANNIVVKGYPADLGVVRCVIWFFGLNTQEFIKIFGSRHYTFKDVVNNISKFMEENTSNT